MGVRAAAAPGPVETSVGFRDCDVIDACFPTAHQTARRELPLLVSVTAKPRAARIMPFVSEPYGDPIVGKCPYFFDEAVLSFGFPLAREERDDRCPPGEKLRAISPATLLGICAGDALGIATVPRIFREPRFLCSGLGSKGRQRRTFGHAMKYTITPPSRTKTLEDATGGAHLQALSFDARDLSIYATGTLLFASLSRAPSSVNSGASKSSRAILNMVPSSSLTWCSTFSMSTVNLAA